ncbi:integrin beta-6 [Alosa pseudoharengus]|uniref:integrin beta-6 n=1 Tax=Alosa pseudoharengus TaxID=34774 RepID=UPI003F8B88B4
MGIALVFLGFILQYCHRTVEGTCSVGSAVTCDRCLQLGPQCAWCTQENFTESFSVSERCDTADALQQKGCLSSFVEFPVSSMEVQLNDSLGKADDANFTQIAPQRISVKLRPDSSITLQIKVQQTEDYPVDLYYLMDLSASMYDDLKMIKNLGSTLSKAMAKLTSKFRLGFGSFVEKPVLPFIKITKEELENPCWGIYQTCLPVFGYRHVLSLTSSTQRFSEIVSKQQVSANIDLPECGFDAIMQATVCGDKIGWRNDSMRLLVFVSDDDSHFGMDSKMAGIVLPNDGQCHLDSNNEYSMAAQLEYPTLGQLIEKVVENNILLIFAVTDKVKQNYEHYANLIPGATVGKLEDDSRNIQELIMTAYKELRSEIDLEVLGDTEDLQLSFTAMCQDGSVHPGLKRCSNVKGGDMVTFNVTLQLGKCLPGPRHFHIRPVGMQQALEVELESLCTCNCQRTPQANGSDCGHGTFTCGTCVCEPGYMGPRCECTEEKAQSSDCRVDEEAEMCSGQGMCFCGECVCYPSSFGRVYGPYCNCDDFSCPRFRGELCGGRGECDCGECVCAHGWVGESCNCSSSMAACVSADGAVCSGRGACVCGSCVCSVAGASGDTCEKCPTCGDSCSAIRSCVECHIQQDDSPERERCLHACSSPLTFISNSTDFDESQSVPCSLQTTSECFISFNLVEADHGLTIYNLKHYDCPEPPDIAMIVLGVSLSVLTIGIILLGVWKLLVSVHDRKEVAKFEAERAKAKWQSGTNPLFRSSTSTFKNVTYKNNGRQKVDIGLSNY